VLKSSILVVFIAFPVIFFLFEQDTSRIHPYTKNKLTAASNTSVQFLKSKGFYDRMKKELAALCQEYHSVFPNKVKTAKECKGIGPVNERQRKRV
jgi:hypothetical protein